MKRMPSVGLGLALLVAAPVAAQSPSEFAIEQARSHGENLFPSSSGWQVEQGPVTGSLQDGSSETVEIRLQQGERYAIIGGCDADCSDMDLAISDRSGNTLDSDVLLDDYPALELSAGYTGTYPMRVSMPSCSVSPCYYSYIVYRMTSGGGSGGGGGAAVSGNTPHAQQAREELTRRVPGFFPRADGWAITSEAEVRTLTDGASEELSLSLSGGVDYGVIATCDEDCHDIDLYVYDDAGNELDSDTLGDDYPVLNFRTPYSGTYTVRVRMYECSVEPCYYAYEVYRR